MTCGKIQRLIQGYVDGESSAAEQAAVETHAAACADCGQVLAESRQLASWMAATPARTVSADFDRKLREALPQTAPVHHGHAWWERFCVRFEWRLRVPALVTAGSLATAIVAAVMAPQLTNAPTNEQRVLLTSALQRHHELRGASQDVNWEAVDTSIELNTGIALTE